MTWIDDQSVAQAVDLMAQHMICNLVLDVLDDGFDDVHAKYFPEIQGYDWTRIRHAVWAHLRQIHPDHDETRAAIEFLKSRPEAPVLDLDAPDEKAENLRWAQAFEAWRKAQP